MGRTVYFHTFAMKNQSNVGKYTVRPIDGMRYKLGLPPTQDASHHQNYETFLVGNPNLNLYLPLES